MTLLPKGRRRPNVGSMRDRIAIVRRDLEPPRYGSADFDLIFSGDRARWAQVRTVTGRTFFAGATRGDVAITHEVVIRYDPAVNAHEWIVLESGELLEILAAEKLDQRPQWGRLVCASHGIQPAKAARS